MFDDASGNGSQQESYYGVIVYETINCSHGHDLGVNHTSGRNSWLTEGAEYFDIVIHFFGFVGNILSLIVLWRRRIGGAEMCRLLLLLSVAEVLYTFLSFFPETVELLSKHSARMWLKIFCQVASHTFLSLRNWWIVSIGFVRFFVIWKPLKMKRMHLYKPTGLTVVFVVLLVIWFLESIALTFAFKVRVQHCMASHESVIDVWFKHDDSFSLKFLEGMSLFLRTVFPVILVSIFSCLTVRQIIMSQRLHERGGNNNTNGSFKTSNKRRYSSATKTILGLTITFGVFELPLAFTFIFCFLNFSKDPDTLSALDVYLILSELLVSCDSLCNLFIYCLSCRIYRDELRHLLFCQRRRALKRELSQTDAHTHRQFIAGRRLDRLTVQNHHARKTSDSSNIISNSDVGKIHLEEDD